MTELTRRELGAVAVAAVVGGPVAAAAIPAEVINSGIPIAFFDDIGRLNIPADVCWIPPEAFARESPNRAKGWRVWQRLDNGCLWSPL